MERIEKVLKVLKDGKGERIEIKRPAPGGVGLGIEAIKTLSYLYEKLLIFLEAAIYRERLSVDLSGGGLSVIGEDFAEALAGKEYAALYGA